MKSPTNYWAIAIGIAGNIIAAFSLIATMGNRNDELWEGLRTEIKQAVDTLRAEHTSDQKDHEMRLSRIEGRLGPSAK